MSVNLVERPVWSRTQVAALRDCRRKHAINQKAGQDAAVDPLFAQAAALKKMKNRYLWAGSFVHDRIGLVLKAIRQGEAPPETETLIEQAKLAMRDEFRRSREGKEPAVRLYEHEYEVTLPADVWRAHWTNVETALRWFLGSKWLARLAALGPECWKAVDELLEFDVNGIKAYVKIDCAIETDGRFILIDWKNSAPSTSAEFPLLVAALYAHEVWGAEAEHTDAMAVSLLDGKTFRATVSEDSLMETHLRTEEESGLLQQALGTGARDPFALPLADDKATCRGCNYQKLCYPSGQIA